MIRYTVASALLFAWCVASAQAGDLRVKLSATEPDGVARKAEPISGGIPLPRGAYKPGEALVLTRSDGQVLPSQILPLALDTDGSARWILVDFQDDLAAGATQHYELRRPGADTPAAARRGASLKVNDTDDAVTIDTGSVNLVIAKKKAFTLFERVSAGGKDVLAGGEVRYTDGMNGKTFRADVPSSVEIEYNGPMRTTVAVRGHFVGDDDTRLLYIARITAWSGSGKVQVKYALANSNPDHYTYRSISDSSIALKLAGAPEGSWLGLDRPTTAGATASVAQAFSSKVAGSAKAFDGGKEIWSLQDGKEGAQGWIATRSAAPLWVCDLYFRDDPARKLALADGSLVLSGVVERWRSTQKDRSGGEAGRPYNGTARALYDSSHLSSQYVFDFTPPATGEELAALVGPAQTSVHLFAAPKWYLQETDTSPLWPFADQEDELASYKTWNWAFDDKDIPAKSAVQYGRYRRTHDNHFEPEQDCLNQIMLMYMRTGKQNYLDNAQTWANFWMDTVAWRTDGWQWKDGGVWWGSGPRGNSPQRKADPRTGVRNSTPGPRGSAKAPLIAGDLAYDMFKMGDSKTCHCHNWGEGLLAWYCLTGDRDALEAVMDRVEQDYDSEIRAAGHAPNRDGFFSRAFNRSVFLAQAVRLTFPTDEFIRKASDQLAQSFLKRSNKEPRGLVNSRSVHAAIPDLANLVGAQGMKALADTGNTFDAKTGTLTDKAGRSWKVINDAATWMHPPQSAAMYLYWRITGDEDARDYVIAYGQAAAKIIHQRQDWMSYGKMVVDFPSRGITKDYAAWVSDEKNPWADGVGGEGFLSRFYPDVCARAYSLSGDPLLKQRAKEFWNGGSHREYGATKMMPLDRVGIWLNYRSSHDGGFDNAGLTFYIWAHPRTDTTPPAAVTDLAATVDGDKATITFAAPADQGGKAVSYQVKCSDKPIVDYDEFLTRYNNFEDDKCTNWWMASNVAAEPAPQAAGTKESFVVTGVPAGAKYFAVRSYDDSNNRSAMSNVAGK